MHRIDVVYGSTHYTVADRSLDELKDEIAQAASGGEPYWLRVNRGEGLPQPTELLITANSDVALIDLGATAAAIPAAE